jgi:hypothetical protein
MIFKVIDEHGNPQMVNPPKVQWKIAKSNANLKVQSSTVFDYNAKVTSKGKDKVVGWRTELRVRLLLGQR